MMVCSMDEDLRDAVLRVAELLRHPERIPVLSPLIRREIWFKLLLGEQSGMLRRMAASAGKVSVLPRVSIG